MTQRERIESKLARRQVWANRHREQAQAGLAIGRRYAGDIAFNTQPGHIPERARVIRAQDRAFEHLETADYHEGKAAGLAAQLDRTVFSDDANAIEALEARIREHEATRDRMKLVNKLYKKKDAAGLAALGLNLDALAAKLAAAGPYWGDAPHLPYELTNLGARIRADRERIAEIQRRQARTAAAETNGGVVIEGGDWIRVTFADKPDRETLDALRAAGFQWGGGSWTGQRCNLPACVAA